MSDIQLKFDIIVSKDKLKQKPITLPRYKSFVDFLVQVKKNQFQCGFALFFRYLTAL